VMQQACTQGTLHARLMQLAQGGVVHPLLSPYPPPWPLLQPTSEQRAGIS
jgi:hypothetical protein